MSVRILNEMARYLLSYLSKHDGCLKMVSAKFMRKVHETQYGVNFGIDTKFHNREIDTVCSAKLTYVPFVLSLGIHWEGVVD